MLTIVTTPKPFEGHQAIIQRNAICSWLALRPVCEVILIGNDKGTADVAAEFGLQHRPDVACSESGLPLLDSFLEIAQSSGTFSIMAMVSADIILMADFLPAIGRITKPSFLMAAQRWDLDVQEEIDFTEADWETQLHTCLADSGKLHPPTAGDLLVFSRGLWHDIPPFVIGRASYDNWLFYRARSLGVPVINATQVVTIVHQNHGYPKDRDWDWKKPEAVKNPEYLKNLELAGGYSHSFTLQDASWVLTLQGLKRPRLTRQRFCRQLNTLPVLYPHLGLPLRLARALLSPRKLMHAITNYAKNVIVPNIRLMTGKSNRRYK